MNLLYEQEDVWRIQQKKPLQGAEYNANAKFAKVFLDFPLTHGVVENEHAEGNVGVQVTCPT